jgi:hypothetical protein
VALNAGGSIRWEHQRHETKVKPANTCINGTCVTFMYAHPGKHVTSSSHMPFPPVLSPRVPNLLLNAALLIRCLHLMRPTFHQHSPQRRRIIHLIPQRVANWTPDTHLPQPHDQTPRAENMTATRSCYADCYFTFRAVGTQIGCGFGFLSWCRLAGGIWSSCLGRLWLRWCEIRRVQVMYLVAHAI